MTRKTRTTEAEWVQATKTSNGAITHAKAKLARDEAALAAHRLSPQATAASIAELEARIVAANTRIETCRQMFADDKAGLAAFRAGQPAPAAGSSTPQAGKPASQANGPVTGERTADRLNRQLCALIAGADADWTPELADSLADWLLNRPADSYYVAPAWNEAQLDLIAAHDAIDAMPVDEATKAILRKTQPARPQRPQAGQLPVWGQLPEAIVKRSHVNADPSVDVLTCAGCQLAYRGSGDAEGLCVDCEAKAKAEAEAALAAKAKAEAEAAKAGQPAPQPAPAPAGKPLADLSVDELETLLAEKLAEAAAKAEAEAEAAAAAEADAGAKAEAEAQAKADNQAIKAALAAGQPAQQPAKATKAGKPAKGAA